MPGGVGVEFPPPARRAGIGGSGSEDNALDRRSRLPGALPILIGASVMLTLAMGIRQSLGIFMPSLTAELAVSVADFSVAIAIQHQVWGMCQHFAGALLTAWGYRPVMIAGAVLHVAGPALSAAAARVLTE